MDSDTKVCPTCGQERMRREFRIYNELVDDCRACRHRARARVRAAMVRESEKLDRFLKARNKRLTEQHANPYKKSMLKIIKSEFLRATRVTRQRIADMEKQTLTPHRSSALAKRRELLRRYEAAYAKQRDSVERGFKVQNIHDMVAQAGDAA